MTPDFNPYYKIYIAVSVTEFVNRWFIGHVRDDATSQFAPGNNRGSSQRRFSTDVNMYEGLYCKILEYKPKYLRLKSMAWE